MYSTARRPMTERPWVAESRYMQLLPIVTSKVAIEYKH